MDGPMEVYFHSIFACSIATTEPFMQYRPARPIKPDGVVS